MLVTKSSAGVAHVTVFLRRQQLISPFQAGHWPALPVVVRKIASRISPFHAGKWLALPADVRKIASRNSSISRWTVASPSSGCAQIRIKEFHLVALEIGWPFQRMCANSHLANLHRPLATVRPSLPARNPALPNFVRCVLWVAHSWSRGCRDPRL